MTELEQILLKELKTYGNQFNELEAQITKQAEYHKEEQSSLRELVKKLMVELSQNDHLIKTAIKSLEARDLELQNYWRQVTKMTEQLKELESDLEIVAKGQNESEETFQRLLKNTNNLLEQLQIE